MIKIDSKEFLETYDLKDDTIKEYNSQKAYKSPIYL